MEERREEENIQKINNGQNYKRKQLRGFGDLRFAIHRYHTHDNYADYEDNCRG